MSDHWTEVSLGDFVELVPGRYIPKAEYVDDGPYFIYGSNSVMGKYSDALIREPHVVMAAIGAYAGAVRFSAEPSWINNNAFGLVCRPEVEPFFLYLWLTSQLALEQVVVGTGQPYVQRPALKAVRVSLPSLAAQKRIVDLVASVDAYIAGLEKQAEAARTARNAVLHELLTSGGKAWLRTTLGEVARLEIGRTPPRNQSKYWTDDVTLPFCTIADMEGKWVDPQREGVTPAALTDGKARRAERGSLLMSFKLTIGRMGFASRDVYPNEAIVCINPDESVASKEFLYLSLGHQDLSAGSGRAVKGNTLNSKSLAEIPVVVPPLNEQRRIVDIIESVDAVVLATERALDGAKRLRTGLLSDLLSGKHEISESYDKFLGAA